MARIKASEIESIVRKKLGEQNFKNLCSTLFEFVCYECEHLKIETSSERFLSLQKYARKEFMKHVYHDVKDIPEDKETSDNLSYHLFSESYADELNKLVKDIYS